MAGARWVGRLTHLGMRGATALCLTVAVAEILVRLAHPTPRAQIVRSRRPGDDSGLLITVRHGQPTWEQDGTPERHHDACVAAPGRRVALFGTSISFGISLPPEDTLGARLEQVLNRASGGGWCVHNYAQPAYTGSTKLALAADVVPALRPDLVVWEVWSNEADWYTEVDGDWYNFHGRPLDAAGLPVGLLAPGPSAALFRHSALYRYGLLALAPTGRPLDEVRREFDARYLPPLATMVEQTPGRDVFFRPFFFDRPLAPQMGPDPGELATIHTWSAGRDLPFVNLAEAWRDEDLAPLAIDSCHWSALGSQRAAEVLAPLILAGAG